MDAACHGAKAIIMPAYLLMAIAKNEPAFAKSVHAKVERHSGKLQASAKLLQARVAQIAASAVNVPVVASA